MIKITYTVWLKQFEDMEWIIVKNFSKTIVAITKVYYLVM